MAFNDNIVSMTRVVTGSTEVMTGEQTSSSQSGAAIATLQSQALKPIQELRDRFLRFCKRQAKILKQFYELYYDEKQFEYKTEANEYTEETFNGRDYQGMLFDISVEAGAGTPYSESLMIQLLAEFLQAGYIDFSTYLDLLPAQIATFKGSLQKELQEGNFAKLQQMQQQMAMLQEQNQQLQAYLQKQQEILQKQGKSVEGGNRLVNEVRRLNAQLISLQNEYTDKINQANAVNQQTMSRNQELMKDAQTMAQMLADDDMLMAKTQTE
jgi:myosin heavy subunit